MTKTVIFAAAIVAAGVLAGIAIRRINMKNRRTHDVIDEEEYTSNGKFKKRVLEYYILDDTLADINGKVIVNTLKTVGPDWQDDHRLSFRISAASLYLHNKTSDNLYIRNYITKTDFLILPVLGSYVHAEKGDIKDALFEARLKRISKEAEEEILANVRNWLGKQNLPSWDQKVADYCVNDAISTEEAYHRLSGDWKGV